MAKVGFTRTLNPTGFDMAASFPHRWGDSAQRNRRAAKLLYDKALEDEAIRAAFVRKLVSLPAEERGNLPPYPRQPDLLATSLYLYALALENLLKGIVVASSSMYVKGGKLPKRLKNHKLEELADLAKVTCDPRERGLLAFLSSCSDSWGRYHIAIDLEKYPTEISFELTIGEELECLYQRFTSVFDTTAHDFLFPPEKEK